MLMRKIKLTDYAQFRPLYVNCNLQWMYKSSEELKDFKCTIPELTEAILKKHEKKINEKYELFSYKDFEKLLVWFKNGVYVFVDDNDKNCNLIGYVILEKYPGNELYIGEWAVKNEVHVEGMYKCLRRKYPQKDFVAWVSPWQLELWQNLQSKYGPKE